MANQTVTRPASLSDNSLKRAQLILAEIAAIAHRTDCLSQQAEGSISGDVEAMELDRDHLRAVVCQLGHLADVANEQLGASSLMGRGSEMEAWILPRGYRMLKAD